MSGPSATGGAPHMAAPLETDAVVIGAGPVGLFQVFQLGLLEIRTHLVDALPAPGGQPAELYPDKPIYDVPGVPVCTGRELTASLLRQIAPFQVPMHLGQEVTTLERQADGRLLLTTSRGTALLTRTVFIAAGVGAFQPRTLKLDGLAAFDGTQLFHHQPEPAATAGEDVVVLGSEASAIDWALACARPGPGRARRVRLVHRRDHFDADAGALAALADARASGAVKVVIGQPVGIEQADGRLCALQLATPDGQVVPLQLSRLLLALGLSPRLGPLAHWGLAMERKQLRVNTEAFATAEPGIYAVGDINTYPGKRKLLVCGFHECTLAAYDAAARLRPDQPLLLQYTTTSPRLHRLLGVAPVAG